MEEWFVIISDNQKYEARIQYVFDFIQNHPLAVGKVSFLFKKNSNTDRTLIYGSTFHAADEFDFFIPSQHLILSEVSSFHTLFANKYSYEDLSLFSVESKVTDQQPFLLGKQFQFDLVETIFFHISRLEEIQCIDSEKDVHGRMLSKKQFLVKHGISKIAVVDHLVFCFLNAIGVELRPQTTSHRITFDVDLMRKYPKLPPFRSTKKYGFDHFNLKSLVKLWQSYFLTIFGMEKDPYDVFDWMLEESEQKEQIVYFLVGSSSKFDKPYPVLNTCFKEVLTLVKKRGIKVGLHPSYNSWTSAKVLIEEKKVLEDVYGESIECSRQHFLHFSLEHTAHVLELAGISEDSTLGFSDRIGFRCGTGFPYHLYNFREEQPFTIKEVPMVIMDIALLREASYDDARVWSLWSSFLNENRSLTFITFNFHNSTFFDASLDGINLRALFLELYRNP